MADDALAGLGDDALALATRASAAAHVDIGLLRRLRLRFVPGADASIEASLWHSAAIENATSNALSFAPDALAALRARLAAGGAPVVDETCEEIARHHEGAPPLVLVEERLIRHALAGRVDGIDAALHDVLGSLAHDGDERRTVILHWAASALPRLPAAAQRTTAAWALALAAQQRFEREILPGAPPAELRALDLSMYVTDRVAPLLLRARGDGLVLGGAMGVEDAGAGGGAEPHVSIDVADTHPRVVWIERVDGPEAVVVPEGGEARVDDVVYPFELRDLRGRRWMIRADEATAAIEEDRPVVVRILALSDLRLTAQNLFEVDQRLRRLRAGLANQPLDATVIVGNLVDGAAADERVVDAVSALLGTWPSVFVVPGPSDALRDQLVGTGRWFSADRTSDRRVVDVHGYRVGLVGLDTRHAATNAPPIALDAQLREAVGGDHPQLFREEVDAAVLLAAIDPTERGYRLSSASQLALDVFDARVVGAEPTEPGDLEPQDAVVPSFTSARGPCAFMLELAFRDRRLVEVGRQLLDADGRVVREHRGVELRPDALRPRRLGRRAATRREIIRALDAGTSVLLVGAQATGKTTLIAELVGAPWLEIERAPSIADAQGGRDGVSAMATMFDPGADLGVLVDEQDPPLLLEAQPLPFEEPPELGPRWQQITLERFELADILDELAHVERARRGQIARWLLAETGGDPWLVWRAIAGARLRDPGELQLYRDALATAAMASVSDLTDLAAIELLGALRAGPRTQVDRRARYQLERLGIAQRDRDGALRLSSPAVRRVVDDDAIQRLRLEALGEIPEAPTRWIRVQGPPLRAVHHAIATALIAGRCGLELDPETEPALAATLTSIAGTSWVRDGGASEVLIVFDRPPPTLTSVMMRSADGPDHLHARIAELLEGIDHGGRPVSLILLELGVLDIAAVTVGTGVVRKADRRTRVASVPGLLQVRISDVEARRLLAAGAREGASRASRRKPDLDAPVDDAPESLADDGEAVELAELADGAAERVERAEAVQAAADDDDDDPDIDSGAGA